MVAVPAGNLGNAALNLIWGNDPRQQMADLEDTLQARQRVAAGMDLNGNILPSPAPGTPPGVGSGQITGAPVDPTAAMAEMQKNGILSPGQTPNAYKSDPSMGSLILAFQARQEAAAGLQQSIGLGASAFARPENRERVFKSFAPQAPQDAAKLGESLLAMSNAQQGMDRMSALGQMVMDPQRGPAIAQQLNIGWEELKARYQADPGGVGTMIQQYLTPTDDLKNLAGINRMGGGVGGASSSLNDAGAGIIGKIGGQPDMDMAQRNWRNDPENKGKPDSAMPWRVNDPSSFRQFTENERQKETDRGQAAGQLANIVNTTQTIQGDLESIREDPGLQKILSNGARREIATKALTANTSEWEDIIARNLLDPDEKRVVAKLRQIRGGQTADALHSLVGTGTRVTQQEVMPLQDSLGTVQNLNQTYEDYIRNAINPAIKRAKQTMGNAHGAAGTFVGMDPQYNFWTNPVYRKGGELFKKGSGAENFGDLKPLTPDMIAPVKAHLINEDPGDKQDSLDHWEEQGYDVSKLRSLPPSKW
jgi:hypothetical protein